MGNAEDTLQALRERIQAEQGRTPPVQAETLPPEAEPEQPQETEAEQVMEQVEKVHEQTPIPEPSVDELPPVDVRMDDVQLKAWIKDRQQKQTSTAITKVRQKEKRKVEELLQSVLSQPRQAGPKPQTVDEIIRTLPDESQEAVRASAPIIQRIAEASMGPLMEHQQFLEGERRKVSELEGIRKLQERYEGYPFTQEMIDRANQIRSAHPDQNVRNATISSIVEHVNRDALENHRMNILVEKKVAEVLAQRKTAHPGGKPGISDARQREPSNLSKMTNEQQLDWYRANLPRA